MVITKPARYIPDGSTEINHPKGFGVVYTYPIPGEGTVAAIAYTGKAKRHTWHFRFHDEARRDNKIKEFFAGLDSLSELETRRAEHEAENLAKMLNEIQVGTILHYSWGYDQTNAEFFQVVERKGQMVTVREITSRQVGPGGSMSAQVVPVPDAFRDAPSFRKKIRPFGLSMKFGIASPVEPGRTYHTSWYA